VPEGLLEQILDDPDRYGVSAAPDGYELGGEA
jgi:hypothetical protein